MSTTRSNYEHEVRQALARSRPASTPITETELAPLPAPVQTYLRRAGVVGKLRPRNFRASFRAEMRRSPTAKWMTAAVEQHNFYDPPARLFFMRAWQLGVPFEAFHRYVDDAATMEVRIAGQPDVAPHLTRPSLPETLSR